MTNEIWINLPVLDIKRSVTFFKKMGCSFIEGRTSDTMACMPVGDKKLMICLFKTSVFEGFVNIKAADTGAGSEVIFSLGAGSRQEVDEMARKAEEAGGTLFAAPGEKDGWMYGCGFTDPDGHRWNPLYMDMDKIPGKTAPGK